MRTTEDLFQKQLHAYTITHAIEDGNVLRFHIDYFKPEGKNPPKPGEAIAKKAVIEPFLPSTMPPPADAASMPSSPPRPSTTPSNTTRCSRPCRRRNRPPIPTSSR
jgi:hypothetical protein